MYVRNQQGCAGLAVSLIVTKERSGNTVFAERPVLRRAGVDASPSGVRSVTWLQHSDDEGALDADDMTAPAVLSGSLRDAWTLPRMRHSSVYVLYCKRLLLFEFFSMAPCFLAVIHGRVDGPPNRSTDGAERRRSSENKKTESLTTVRV